MSAAVATRQSQGPSNPTSRINSPLDTKRHFDEPKKSSPRVSNREVSKNSTSTKQSPAKSSAAAEKAASNATSQAVPASKNTKSTETSPKNSKQSSLPPPPPPPPPAAAAGAPPGEGGDYFSQVHSNKYGEEPNPFEQSFSVPEGVTPGKALLPPASQIASPNPNLGTGSTFNWGFNSLRSGPLSPAMLTGPSAHAYDSSLRTGLTPNESGIRSGLTPGGSGSMFPAPSPNTQALFGFGSGPTPGTLEFQKTAMAAQAANRTSKPIAAVPPLPVAKPEETVEAMDVSKVQQQQPPAPQVRHPSDPFGVDANAAASGLYMLAQQGQQHQTENQFVPANIPQVIPVTSVANSIPMNIDPGTAVGLKRNSVATSGHSRTTSSVTRGQSEGSDEHAGSDGGDPSALKGKKGKGAKKSATNAGVTKTAGNRRKAEEPKVQANKKKPKPSAASSNGDEDEEMEDVDDMDDDDMHGGDSGGPHDGKKMTDEEKRKNFLERNRVAALKCRQRKKQWLANLQAKVEYYGAENDALTAQVTNLREEILTLKTLLLAHKDCPITRGAGAGPLGGLDALGALGQAEYAQVHHGYAVPQVSMAPPGSRRFS